MKKIIAYQLGDTIPHNASFVCKDVKSVVIKRPTPGTGVIQEVVKDVTVYIYEVPQKAEASEKKQNDEAIVLDLIKRTINYLNEKTGSKYTSKSKAHSAKIRARINEGATKETLKEAIDNKCTEWLDDPDMRKYLRPETLFGNKFWGYVSSKPAGSSLDEAFGGIDDILKEVR